MTIQRDSRLDGIKLLLIILVVVGHCIVPTMNTDKISGGIFAVIYSFHMPLFIFLSGYFCKIESFGQWKKKALQFIEPFLIIMLPQCLYFGTFKHLVVCGNSGWYLMSMVWWYGMILLMKKIKFVDNKRRGVIISILVSLIVFLLPLGDYGRLLTFNRTMQFFPFFYAGYYMRYNEIKVPFSITKMLNVLLFVVACFSIVVFMLLPFVSTTNTAVLHILEMYNIDAWSIGSGESNQVLVFFVVRLVLMFLAISFSVLIVANFKLPEKVATIGQFTLVIYVIQGVLAHIIPNILPHYFLLELSLAVLICVISIILIKTIDCRYITNPITTIIHKVKENNKLSNSNFK